MNLGIWNDSQILLNMRHTIFTLFVILVAGCIHTASAANVRNVSMSLYLRQDTLGNAKQGEKRSTKKDKKQTSSPTESTLKNVPKAKNKAIPRTIIPTSINIKSPRISPVKVKVNTQVKIKL